MLYANSEARAAASAQLDADIALAARRARTEEDFRIGAVQAIRTAAEGYGLALDLRAEMAIAAGRADAAYNRVVIELKRPGILRGDQAHRATAAAIQQVQEYLANVSITLGVAISEFAGVVTDGNWYVFVRNVGGSWIVDGPLGRNPTTTSRFLRVVLSLGTGRALTAANLVEDFGVDSNAAAQGVGALYRSLFVAMPGEPLRDALFNEWERLFGAISGVDAAFLDRRARRPLSALARLAGIDAPQPARLLFCVHTYFALVTKLVAYAAVARQTVPLGIGLNDWPGYDDETLLHQVRDLERGGLFRAVGLRNFLEGDFFGWYTSSWTPDVAQAVRAIASALSEYDPGSIEARPELTRDLLKHLYQYLMPRAIRHDLGEYYTPDWLAELALDRANFNGAEAQRLLDPACGSGTFLVLAIARIKADARTRETAPRALLGRILRDVAGFDLNPLAVIASRANYVLAIADLLPHRANDVDIPVYLADSVRPPTRSAAVWGGGVFELELAHVRFDIPSWVQSQEAIERLTAALEAGVTSRASIDAVRDRVGALIPDDEADSDREALAVTYERLTALHDANRNGVWARIIKNAFMPLYVGRFTHVVGNPPWIAWEHLSEAYRTATASLWDHYNLHPPRTQMAMPSRRARSDMAILFTYVAADRYLAPEGTLCFLITQSVFKSEAAGRGFRRFRLPNATSLSVQGVDDFVSFQPFEAATNRTAIIALTIGEDTSYPLPYVKWQPGASGRQPHSEISLPALIASSRRDEWEARPVVPGDRMAPWLTGTAGVNEALSSIVGQSPYRERTREGSNPRGATSVFWVERLESLGNGTSLVRNLHELGRGTRNRRVRMPIEDALIYPLARGRDVSPWVCDPSVHIVLPYTQARPGQPISEDEMFRTYPLAAAYFAEFREELRRRPTFRNFNPGQGVPWELYGVGSYSFANAKAVWREQGFAAAVATRVEGKPVIVDHKLIAVGFEDEDEAGYVGALLNSVPVKALVASYSLDLALSSHLLDYVAVPRFARTNATHTRLAELALEAVQPLNAGRLDEIGVEVDDLAASVWNINAGGLAALRRYRDVVAHEAEGELGPDAEADDGGAVDD